MTTRHHCGAAAAALEEAIVRPTALIGFDGFIDHIIDVVDERSAPDCYRPMAAIPMLAQRIAAAARTSTNLELVVRQRKIGGAAAIMAQAVARLGLEVDVVATLGEPEIDPVFHDLMALARSVTSLGPPALTDALEFADGKIMLGKTGPLDAINRDRLAAVLGARLAGLLAGVDGVATVNWTMATGLSGIWRQLCAEVLPGLRPDRPLWLVDLADPVKRSRDDLFAALDDLRSLERFARVVLGLNGSEARQVAALLGVSWHGDIEDRHAARRCAEDICRRTGLSLVVIHLLGSAAAATPEHSCDVVGFPCQTIAVATGGGDHFNAGLMTALWSGLDLEQALLVAAATSHCYVSTGISPQRAEVCAFLRQGHQ